jgi:peroxiredoxin family protein
MEDYEQRMSALRQGDYLPPADDLYDFNADMKAVSTAHKKKTVEQDSYMTKEELMELRKVQKERIEVCPDIDA